MTIRRRVRIDGRVQGVFFRDSCAREARGQGVGGYVCNRGDGGVEAVFEGEADAVERMMAWCQHGPPRAVVTAVCVEEEQPHGDRWFAVR
ncbi:MAG: acylphosphatase [Actinomycetota bacterium]|nr:acylphosphatase [Actinomycetota bacterium]